MKKICFLLLLLFFGRGLLFSQVGVNTDGTSPHNSAMLDVKSENSGFLPPRMTIVQRDAIPAPAEGLLVFCTDCGYNFSSAMSIFINGRWRLLADEAQPYTWSCGSSITINHVAGVVAPVSKTVTYNTVTGIPGEPSKCWITSNLGSDHQALAVNDATEASAGWYWQFNLMQGFKHDGTTRTPNTAWIGDHPENSDWTPAHDPCAIELGNGWRIPTFTEWNNVDANTGGNWNTWNDAWASDLKLHGAGYLMYFNGDLYYRGAHGYIWSSTQFNDGGAVYLDFDGGFCNPVGIGKVFGLTVRCIRAAAPILTTANISDITQNTATCGGNVVTDGGAAITARGVCWSTLTGPTIADSHTTDGSGTGVFTSNITSLSLNTTYHVRAYATNSLGTTYGNEVGFTTLPWPCGTGVPCPGTPTVTYDGQVYCAVLIGTQCWLTENLNIGTRIDGTTEQTNNSLIEKYCYNNLESNCEIYGGLYQWNEMMQYSGSQGVQGICPSGWHLPTDGEWTTLTNFLGGGWVAGGKMKSTGTFQAGTGLWYSPNTGATNVVGFSAIPGGMRNPSGGFDEINSVGFWWTSTYQGQGSAWHRDIFFYAEFIQGLAYGMVDGFSVRCVKD